MSFTGNKMVEETANQDGS